MGKLDAIVNHMGNFFDCVRSRNTPISDVVSQHRTVSVCHLGEHLDAAGPQARRGTRTKEQFVGDDEANARLQRPQRKGYEIHS